MEAILGKCIWAVHTVVNVDHRKGLIDKNVPKHDQKFSTYTYSTVYTDFGIWICSEIGILHSKNYLKIRNLSKNDTH